MSASAVATRLGFLGPITTRLMNPLMLPLAGRLPGLAVLTHVGRATGRTYRTPLLVLRRGDELIVGLWYGPDVQWVKNVLVAGQAELTLRNRTVRVVEPEIYVDRSRRPMPFLLRSAGSLVGLSQFMRLRVA